MIYLFAVCLTAGVCLAGWLLGKAVKRRQERAFVKRLGAMYGLEMLPGESAEAFRARCARLLRVRPMRGTFAHVREVAMACGAKRMHMDEGVLYVVVPDDMPSADVADAEDLIAAELPLTVGLCVLRESDDRA